MHYFLLTALIAIFSAPVVANDLGVSISVGQPGFYGQINLGNNYPRPQLIYPDPILVMEAPIHVQQQPIYLHVPPSHARKWNKYCYRYNACNRSVYFVQRNWYNDTYIPHYHGQNNYQYGYHDSDRHFDDGYKGKHKDKEHGNNKHRGKHDQNHHDRKKQDRGHKRD